MLILKRMLMGYMLKGRNLFFKWQKDHGLVSA